MISAELLGIIQYLENYGRMSFQKGATNEQLAQFEKENDIHLPAKYKEWLLFSDGGECFLPAGIQLYGVSHDPCIDVKNDDRPDSSFIVIGALSSWDPLLCCREGETISIYNHEAGVIEDDEVYADFFAFLKALPVDILAIGG